MEIILIERDFMTSEVYFADLRSEGEDENKTNKISKLFKASGFDNLINEDDLTAVKLHFGELGCDTYIKPVFTRAVVDEIKKIGADPFLTDTNTMYYGGRHNSVVHIQTAIKHGFGYAVTGAPIIIADGIYGDSFVEIEIGKKHFSKVKIAKDILEANSTIVLSHFKGHGMSGFGGAIKNLGMGFASVSGKLEQHEVAKPIITESCIGCGDCVPSCLRYSLSLKDEKASIDYSLCIGCNACMDACREGAIDLDWDCMPPFIERMTEYAYGAVKGREDKIGYINFLVDITPDCDCVNWSDAPIVPDIGIVASRDPVAIDRASYDLVNQERGFTNSRLENHHEVGEDKFRGVWTQVDGTIQLRYGEEIGLGEQDYELIKIP